MARLTRVYYNTDNYVIGRRHLPLGAGDKILMLMDLNSKGLCIDSPQIRGRDLEEFSRKFNLLTDEERRKSLEVDQTEFSAVLNQCVQCVGCRRRVEHLFHQLTLSGHPTLDPLELRPSCILSITEEKLKTPQALGTLLYRHHDVLNNLLDNKLRNKTRCALHSLDAFRTKPFSETWREVWSAMKNNCRDEMTVIETKELHEVLDNYLKKHKFCTGCRTKIEKAYKILVGDVTTKEKGFAPALYGNIRKCVTDKHIHVTTNKIDFLDALIKRAEPEVNGSYSKLRERHAKTLEIAQEEVLTCVGMIMYERLRRVYVSLREEERACQVLAAVGVHALYRSFDTFVEKKQGVSNLELLYQEISRAEKAKELKRELKKLKKKKKKNEKKNLHRTCEITFTSTGSPYGDSASQGSPTSHFEHNLRARNSNNSSERDDFETYEYKDPLKDVRNDEAYDLGDAMLHHDDNAVIHIEENIDLINCVGEGGVIKNDPESIMYRIETKTEEVCDFKTKPPKKYIKQDNQKQKVEKKKKKIKSYNKKTKETKVSDQHTELIRSSTDQNNLLTSEEKCNGCLLLTTYCSCEHDVRDSGYGSEPTSHTNSHISSVTSSSEGSDVSCSDDLCNHEPYDEQLAVVVDRNNYCSRSVHYDIFAHEVFSSQLEQNQLMSRFSLLQMWDAYDDYDKDDENCHIPQEVVLKYQCQQEKVKQLRQQLRATLRLNFERMCMQRGVLTTSKCH